MTDDEERALRALAGFRASLYPRINYPEDYILAGTSQAKITLGDLEAAERALRAKFGALADQDITIYSTERQLVAFGDGSWEARACKDERAAYIWLCEAQIRYNSLVHQTDTVREEVSILQFLLRALRQSKDRIETSVITRLMNLVQDNGEGWFIIPLLEEDYEAD